MSTAEKNTTIEVHLQPDATNNEIMSLRDGILRVRVTAPPHQGQANRALLALLAGILAVSRSNLSLIRGTTSRHKVIAIEGLSPEELQERLTLILSRRKPSRS